MCVISSTACRVKGDQVHQQESHVISFEGETVILPCVYESSSTNPDLFWYKQRPKEFPKFILRRDKFGSGDNGTEFNERFHSNLNITSSSVPLIIQNLQVSDSAVYYCALRPTVTAVCAVIIQKPAVKTYSCVYSNT